MRVADAREPPADAGLLAARDNTSGVVERHELDKCFGQLAHGPVDAQVHGLMLVVEDLRAAADKGNDFGPRGFEGDLERQVHQRRCHNTVQPGKGPEEDIEGSPPR